MLFWQPIPILIWSAGGVAEVLLLAVFLGSLGLVAMSTFALDHFEFTGFQQAWSNLNGSEATESRFRTPRLYRIVRHPP